VTRRPVPQVPIITLSLAAALALLLGPGPRAAHAAAIPAQAGATAAPGVEVGIADQKVDMFSDPRFQTLGITRARLAIGWDALTSQREVAEIDAWLRGAQAAGVEPLISFMHSRSNRRSVPTPERLKYEFRRFRQFWPWVTTFATWNEANHCGEPLCHRPRLAAAYYRALRRECPTCTIIAPEVLDMPNMRTWVKAFNRKLGYSPRIWGLHNYIEANRFTTRRLRQLLRAAPRAQVWLTETGGLVRRDNASTTDIPEGARHAGEVTRFIFDRILPRNPRISRVYIYHWNAGPPETTWDSGLITPGGRERSALFVLARVLRFGLRPGADFRSRDAP
jgi:polysaccharide biosynthesis protein PslG